MANVQRIFDEEAAEASTEAVNEEINQVQSRAVDQSHPEIIKILDLHDQMDEIKKEIKPRIDVLRDEARDIQNRIEKENGIETSVVSAVIAVGKADRKAEKRRANLSDTGKIQYDLFKEKMF